MIEPHGDVTEDGFLGGKLRLRQPRSGHRAGHDAILLAAATAARPGDRVVDLDETHVHSRHALLCGKEMSCEGVIGFEFAAIAAP